MSYTPGPWWVDVHQNVMAADGMVAFPCISAGFDQAANARILSQAPAMLEALFAADLAFAEHGILASHATRIQIAAAIKAAKGEQ